MNDVPVEVEPLSDSGEAVDALTAPTAVNADADSDAAGEPLVTATIPTALVAEGTEVSLSLQDSFQVQEAPSTEVAAASDPTAGFSSTSPETAGDAGGSTEASTEHSSMLNPPENRMPSDRRLMTRPPPRRIRGRQRKPRARPTPMPIAMTTGRMSRWQKQTRTPPVTTHADAETAAEESAPATTDSATEQAPLAVADEEGGSQPGAADRRHRRCPGHRSHGGGVGSA